MVHFGFVSRLSSVWLSQVRLLTYLRVQKSKVKLFLGFSISYDVTTFISFDYTGNVAQYLQTAVQANPATGFRWHYDFHKVRTSQQHHELNTIFYISQFIMQFY